MIIPRRDCPRCGGTGMVKLHMVGDAKVILACRCHRHQRRGFWRALGRATVHGLGLFILSAIGVLALLALAMLAGCGPQAPHVATTAGAPLPGPAPQAAAVSEADSASCLEDALNLSILAELVTRDIRLERVRRVRASWAPPTEGSPVAYYVFRYEATGPQDTLSRRGIAGVDTFWTFDVPAYLDRVIGSTAGVDSLSRQGPWSEWSEILILDGGNE